PRSDGRSRTVLGFAPGRTRRLANGVDGTDLDAGQTAGAAVVEDGGAPRRAEQSPLGAGGDALAAGRAAGVDDDGHGWYPRGVTIRPATIRVVDDPTMTQLVMPTIAGSRAAKVVRVTD